jgi:hypothetical protein
MELKTSTALYKHLTGLAGTFEVAKHLCLRNYNVSLTQRNFPYVDLFVHNQVNGKSIPIQVKAQRIANSGGYDCSVDHLNIPNLIIVFAAFKSGPKKEMEFFIARAKDVIPYITGQKRSGIARKILVNSDWKDDWEIIEKALQ